MRYASRVTRKPRLAANIIVFPVVFFVLVFFSAHQTKALFIGNSLLTDAKGSGMSASSPDKDYYALVNRALADEHRFYSATRIRGRAWEDCTSTSAQIAWLDSISNELTCDLDYVIIQLGDNVDTSRELAVFESGMNTFIEMVKERCPAAEVIWVGNWRHTSRKQRIMASVCEEQGIPWVDIAPFRTGEYESRIGAEVTYLDGSTATITDRGVALHPNDAGMTLIAEAILSAIDDLGGASL